MSKLTEATWYLVRVTANAIIASHHKTAGIRAGQLRRAMYLDGNLFINGKYCYYLEELEVLREITNGS